MCVSASRRRLDHLYDSHSDADDTIKILLATDNHIGYLERDPVRGQDSINTFREILQLAVKHDVRISVKTTLFVRHWDCPISQWPVSLRSILCSWVETSFMTTDRLETAYTK